MLVCIGVQGVARNGNARCEQQRVRDDSGTEAHPWQGRHARAGPATRKRQSGLPRDGLLARHFSRFKELYDRGGEAALQEICHHRPLRKNRVDPRVEATVVHLALELPAYGQIRKPTKSSSATLCRFRHRAFVASGCATTLRL